MFLGIEIGGTKLQLGISTGENATLQVLERHSVRPELGAQGILQQLESAVPRLMQRFNIQRAGIGFGGPLNAATGVITKSHQIIGWDNVPLQAWFERLFSLPVILGNDCDCAALAEAHFGAGRNSSSLFYVTVGTGVGGGFVVNGQLQGSSRPAVAEIGHLRPGLHEDRPESTVESYASGWGIAAAARAHLSGERTLVREVLRTAPANMTRQEMHSHMEITAELEPEYVADLLNRCEHNAELLTAQVIAEAAQMGNQIAISVLDHAVKVLGWAIAQTITLLAPEKIIIGGGVSLMDDDFFFTPLRHYIQMYVFPPLAKAYEVLPAALGEEVVVHGAIALAKTQKF